MKKPIPKRRRDPAKAEKLARQVFWERSETCLKPLEIINKPEYVSDRKIVDIYRVERMM